MVDEGEENESGLICLRRIKKHEIPRDERDELDVEGGGWFKRALIGNGGDGAAATSCCCWIVVQSTCSKKQRV